MLFDLSEDQSAMRDAVDDFLSSEWSVEKVRKIYCGDVGFTRARWQTMAELGLAGMLVPEEFDGLGLGALDVANIAEVFGHHAAPGPFFAHTIACQAIASAGSDRQKQHWLPRMARGEVLGSVAFCDDAGRWQPEEWSLQADAGQLTAELSHVPLADLADVIVVGLAGGHLALLRVSSRGVEQESLNSWDITRPLSALSLRLAEVDILPGAKYESGRLRDLTLVLLSADAVGGARKCVELAVNYAKERKQFGKTIAHFQAIKHQLADLAMKSEPCRPMMWYAAHALDLELDDQTLSAAHVKSHITDRYVDVARGAVEIFGGIGYTWEFELHFWLKRAMLDYHFMGSPRVHRLRAADIQRW